MADNYESGPGPTNGRLRGRYMLVGVDNADTVIFRNMYDWTHAYARRGEDVIFDNRAGEYTGFTNNANFGTQNVNNSAAIAKLDETITDASAQNRYEDRFIRRRLAGVRKAAVAGDRFPELIKKDMLRVGRDVFLNMQRRGFTLPRSRNARQMVRDRALEIVTDGDPVDPGIGE